MKPSVERVNKSSVYIINSIVEEIASNLVQNLEALELETASSTTLTYTTTIYCDEEDKKRLIGKSGATVQAIRTILHNSVARHGLKTYVKIG